MAERDLRQLVWHRQKLVWMRGAVAAYQLHALAMGEGVRRQKRLWTKKGRAELEGLRLGDWASYRRQELLTLLDQLDGSLLAEVGSRRSGTIPAEPSGGSVARASRRRDR